MAETEIKSINGKTLVDVTAREKKIDKNQGVENAGKILGIDVDGNVTPQNKPVQALAGASAPTTTTAGVVGQEYFVIVDNAVTEMYVCTSALIGSYTWDKVEFGGACMDITGAKVGQIAKITAVDSAGKPTSWGPVDMPSGGTYTLPIASPTVLGGVKPIAKTDAMTQGVGVDAAGELWTAVGGSGGGFPKFETIYEHTVTADETTNIALFSITNTNVPNLGDYNVFACVIEFAENTAMKKWVKMRINNEWIANISGGVASAKSKIYSCSANRLFGHWIGSNVNDVQKEGKNIPAVIVPSIYYIALNHDNDATSIGIGSYLPDFGLVEGTILRIYAAK